MHLPSRIILHETIDPRSTFGASVLLHELVHALQAVEGPAVPGSAQWHNREREAYAAQRRYLMRHGLAAPGRFGLGSSED
ncbi:MAG: hypothetical protein KIS79_11915 [Burkholderiales bacterium]|nr:hypothetical protein [Burkholderiales bacterium]